MNASELAELRAEANKVADRDYHLGSFLHGLLTHLASAHGLSDAPQSEDAPADEEETVTTPVVKGKGR